jgi:hypothetical protein
MAPQERSMRAERRFTDRAPGAAFRDPTVARLARPKGSQNPQPADGLAVSMIADSATEARFSRSWGNRAAGDQPDGRQGSVSGAQASA